MEVKVNSSVSVLNSKRNEKCSTVLVEVSHAVWVHLLTGEQIEINFSFFHLFLNLLKWMLSFSFKLSVLQYL